MSIKINFKIRNDQNQIVDHIYIAENTWMLRSQELLRHEHYVEMANIAKICPTIVECDIHPINDNGMMVCYRVGGMDINGLMHFAVGSASPGNVKMQGAYFPEMAYKRAYDTWVTDALGFSDRNIGSQESVSIENISADEIGQPELVKVDFGKNRGKTLGEIWNENPSFITDWLTTDKFEPKSRETLFLKQAALAFLKKNGGVTNNAASMINNTSAPVQQQNVQQPVQQQNVQQPVQQQNVQQPVQQDDRLMLRSKLQQIWTERGYNNDEAQRRINEGYRTNSITYNNITLEQIQGVLQNIDSAFPLKQPVQQQMQQPVQNNGNEFYCAGNHPQPQLLKKAEIDFCRQNSAKLGGNLYCMSCQSQFRNGNATPSSF